MHSFFHPEQDEADYSRLHYSPFDWHGVTQPLDFRTIVSGLFDESILSATVDSFMEVPSAEKYPTNQSVVMVSKKSNDEGERRKREFAERTQAKRAQDAKDRLEREAEYRREEDAAELRRGNTQALLDRQSRVLGKALLEISKNTSSDYELWIGAPAEKWNPEAPASTWRVPGTDKTGQGIPIWKGPKNGDRSLVGIVCPVASRLSPGLGYSWSKRNVVVYVETDHEAGWVSKSLGWKPTFLRVMAKEI